MEEMNFSYLKPIIYIFFRENGLLVEYLADKNGEITQEFILKNKIINSEMVNL